MRMRAEGRWILALAIALGSASTGCKEYPTEGDLTVLYARIGAAHARSREAAITKVLGEHRAKPLTLVEETVSVPREAEGCAGNAATPTFTLQGKTRAYVLDCTAIGNLAWGRGPVDATSDGTTFALVPSRTPANDGVVVATGASGELYAIAPSLEVVTTHQVRVRGTCNRMPSPPMMPFVANFYAVEKRAASEVKTLATPYRGEDTEDVCDAYVE